MSLAVSVLGWIGLGVLGVTVLVLLTPIWMRFDARGGPRPVEVNIRAWGFRVWTNTAHASQRERKPNAPTRSKPQQPRGRWHRFTPARYTPLLRLMAGRPGLRLGRRTLAALHMRGRLQARVGFDDPAHTGLIAAPLYALESQLHARGLKIDPAFEGETLIFEGELKVRTSLAQLSWPLVRFAFEPGAGRAIWTLCFGVPRAGHQSKSAA